MNHASAQTASAPTRAEHQSRMATYAKAGEARAEALGNKGPIRFDDEGRLQVSFGSEADQSYGLEFSTDLINWEIVVPDIPSGSGLIQAAIVRPFFGALGRSSGGPSR